MRRFDRAGEGTSFVAEHLALEQRLGHAAAVDGREVALSPAPVVVQAARHQLLAGAGLAEDQHVGIGAGHVEHQPAQALHRRGTADEFCFDRLVASELAAQVVDLQAQRAFFQRALDHLCELLGEKGFSMKS
jgi:hypothetical protein